MNVADALERYLVQLRADGRSEHTVAQARRHVRALAAWLEERGHAGAVGDLDHEDLALFLASPAATLRPDGRPKKQTSVNTMRSSLRAFFGYLSAAGHVASNPGRLIRRARCGPPPPRALSDDEQRRLLDVLAISPGWQAKRDLALIRVMLESGLRVGSALALEVGDLDVDRGELRLRSPKGGYPQVAYMPPGLAEHLRGYIGGRRRGPLFPGRRGRALCARQVRRRLLDWCHRARVRPIPPHGLRHSFAVNLHARTGDLLVVKEALGHRSLSATMVYAKLAPGRLQAVLQEA